MSSSNDEEDASIAKVIVGGVVLGSMALRGCYVHSQLPVTLHDVDLTTQEQQVPGTNFSMSDSDAAQVVVVKGIQNVPITLVEGVNKIKSDCNRRDREKYTYELNGAFGEVRIGQPTNFAGSEDDVGLARTNGETLRLSHDCPGGKSSDHSVVYIEIQRP